MFSLEKLCICVSLFECLPNLSHILREIYQESYSSIVFFKLLLTAIDLRLLSAGGTLPGVRTWPDRRWSNVADNVVP